MAIVSWWQEIYKFYPVILVTTIILITSLGVIIAYFSIHDKKRVIGFDRNMKDRVIAARLLGYARPYFKSYIVVLVLMAVSISYDVYSPMLIGNVEELVKDSFELKDLYSYVAFFVAILLASVVSTYFQAIILQKTGQKILTAIREDLFIHIEKLSHNQLNHIPVGTLVTRETNDTNAISRMFTNLLVNLIKNIFIIIGVFLAMLFLNRGLTLLVICFFPFILLFSLIFRVFLRRAYRRLKDGHTAINIFLSENLSGIKITQVFNNEEKVQKIFREKNREVKLARQQEIMVFSIFRPIIYMLYISSVLLLLYFCGKGYIDGVTIFGQKISSGVLVAFYMYLNKFFTPIQDLAGQFNQFQSAFASAEKDFTILDIVPEIQDSPNAFKPERLRGEIEFKNVWFAYEDENWVLQDISFHISPGETVAFVGSTGSGKTTILSLVCRNYDIQKGQILIDGRDIREYDIRSLRSHFGQMLQDVFLFSGTVRSNIVLREDSFTDKEIMESCAYVNADKFINSLPKKLEEEVIEGGKNFSTGQRQLLSFARTIIHKPEVMILDEATANIDTETEMLIQDSLEKMMNIGTMLMVAHRLSTIKNADTIMVVSKGRIIERGNHNQLLEKGGKYYELYKLQGEKRSTGLPNII